MLHILKQPVNSCHEPFKCYVQKRLIAFKLPCSFTIMIYCGAKHSGQITRFSNLHC